MLHIQSLLRSSKTIESICSSREIDYKFSHDKSKVILTYSQIDSPKLDAVVRECRGLILYCNSSWDVAAMGLERFFNLGETGAEDLGTDLGKALVLPKLDGTMINLWWDRISNQWRVSTRGMMYADGTVGTLSTKTFSDLFWEAVDNTALPGCCLEQDTDLLKSGCTYTFELTSPENRIVTPYTEVKATLLTIRDNTTLKELSNQEVYRIGLGLLVKTVRPVSMSNWEELLKMQGLAPTDEGFVVVRESNEGSHRRVKVKNPAYLAIAHMVAAPTERNFMGIVKSGQMDEYLAYYPEYRDNVKRLADGVQTVATIARKDYVDLQGITDRKSFALEAIKRKFPELLFGMRDGKYTTLATDLLLLPIDKLLLMVKRAES